MRIDASSLTVSGEVVASGLSKMGERSMRSSGVHRSRGNSGTVFGQEGWQNDKSFTSTSTAKTKQNTRYQNSVTLKQSTKTRFQVHVGMFLTFHINSIVCW